MIKLNFHNFLYFVLVNPLSKQISAKERAAALVLCLAVSILSFGTVPLASHTFLKKRIVKKFGPTQESQVFNNLHSRKEKNDTQTSSLPPTTSYTGSFVEEGESSCRGSFSENEEESQTPSSSIFGYFNRSQEVKGTVNPIDSSADDQDLSENSNDHSSKVDYHSFFPNFKRLSSLSDNFEVYRDRSAIDIEGKGKEKMDIDSDEDDEQRASCKDEIPKYHFINFTALKDNKVKRRKRLEKMEKILENSLEKWKDNKYNFFHCSSSSSSNPFFHIFERDPIVFTHPPSTKSIQCEKKKKTHQRRNTN